ncbi:hypothetical protein C8R44DRAFT_887778 [Mycena epipterygia]|nr:hypothetical protein C8R44DRAFT_887778 [Mycena epipterygia]
MKFVELHCSWLHSQTICGYGPVVDKLCLTLLKGHLGGAALEWYLETVNSAHFEPQEPMSFSDVLCALHHRFVTSANAQRATQVFDAVRFDNTKGPDLFAELLVKRANQMHHAPDEFMVSRRSLMGLPQTIRYKMRVDRQFTAEYTPFAVLRYNARQLWAALNGEDGTANTSSACTTSTPARATAAPAPGPRRSATTEPTPPRPAMAPRPLAINDDGRDKRICFKCSGIGHIGSNPLCPWYNDPPSRPQGPRVGAQRVLESYADEDNTPDEEIAVGPDNAGDEEMEGLWNDPRYELGEDDPSTAPDLEELLALQSNEPVCVGAIQVRAQYYSLRIPEPEEEVPAGPMPGPSEAVLNLDRLQLRFAGEGYAEWTAAEEARLALASPGPPPSAPPPTFRTLLAKFETRTGTAPLTLAQTMELESIDALGTEENARTVWHGIIRLQPGIQWGFDEAALRTTAVDVETVGGLFIDRIFDTRQYQQDLLELLARRLDARMELDRMADLPSDMDSAFPGHVLLAQQENQRLCADIDHHLRLMECRLQQLLASQSMVNDELTWRMLEREAFTLPVPLASTSSTHTPHLREFPRAASVDDAVPEVPAAAFAPPSPSPPLIGSTPPPSYPSTPESSVSQESSGSELWVTLPDHQEAVNSASNLPGDAPIWISDSEGEEPLGLRANRIDDEPLVESHTLAKPCIMVPEDHDSLPLFGPPLLSPSLDVNHDPRPGESPRLISRAIYRLGDVAAAQVLTYLCGDGMVYIEYAPLPELHYLNNDFRCCHEDTMDLAILGRAAHEEVSPDQIRRLVTLDVRSGHAADDSQTRHRHGFLDHEPKLLPGTNFHDRVASRDPEHDDGNALPGFRVQVLTQQLGPMALVERLSNVRRSSSKEVGLLDQPKRERSNMACLSALLSIGSSKAYMLFDSGSNTDSITPEYAHTTDSPRIRLEEQVTLQLGCVGSRSKINYGTRAAIEFGGIKGHLYR